jgi:hypothetical protein
VHHGSKHGKSATITSAAPRARPQIIEQLNLGDFTQQTYCTVDVDQPIFQPFPLQIHFEAYEAQRAYSATLSLRNDDKVPYLESTQLGRVCERVAAVVKIHAMVALPTAHAKLRCCCDRHCSCHDQFAGAPCCARIRSCSPLG